MDLNDSNDGGSGILLDPGAYVVAIESTSVEVSKDGHETLKVVWDVCEGEAIGFHDRHRFTRENLWTHSLWVNLASKAAVDRFKWALMRSNDGFSGDFDPHNRFSLMGKVLGIVLVDRLYTTRDGEDRHGRRVARWYPADEIRRGEHADEALEAIDDRIDAPRPRDAAGDALAEIGWDGGFCEVNAVRCAWCGEAVELYEGDAAGELADEVGAGEMLWNCPECGRGSHVSADILLDIRDAAGVVAEGTPYGGGGLLAAFVSLREPRDVVGDEDEG
jgi:hypothetical protein